MLRAGVGGGVSAQAGGLAAGAGRG
eukprot:COSAG03_NODE_1876_length_3399_cov_3.350303_1_plen_24_part_10